MENKTVVLSKSQCGNLAEFIEFNLYDEIRRDDGIDNIDWVCDIVDAYRAFKEAAKK